MAGAVFVVYGGLAFRAQQGVLGLSVAVFDRLGPFPGKSAELAERICRGSTPAACSLPADGDRRAGSQSPEENQAEDEDSGFFLPGIQNGENPLFHPFFTAVKIRGKSRPCFWPALDGPEENLAVLPPALRADSIHDRRVAGKLALQRGGLRNQIHHGVEPVDGGRQNHQAPEPQVFPPEMDQLMPENIFQFLFGEIGPRQQNHGVPKARHHRA